MASLLLFSSISIVHALNVSISNDTASHQLTKAQSPTVSCRGCNITIQHFDLQWYTEILTHTAATIVITIDKSTNTTKTSTIRGDSLIIPTSLEYGLISTPSDSLFTTVLGRVAYTLTYPTRYSGIGGGDVTSAYMITDSAGRASCVLKTIGLSEGWFLNVSNAPPDLLSPYSTCGGSELSPPGFLLRVESLTSVSTTYISTPTTSSKALPSPTLSSPTAPATTTSSKPLSFSVKSASFSATLNSQPSNQLSNAHPTSTTPTTLAGSSQVRASEQSSSIFASTTSQASSITVQSSSSQFSHDKLSPPSSVSAPAVPTLEPSKTASQIAQNTGALSAATQLGQAPSPSSIAQIVHVNGQSLTEGTSITEASRVIVYSSGSLYIDNSAIPLSATSYLLSPSSTIIHGLTVSLAPGTRPVSPISSAVSILTIGNSILTADSASHFPVGSQTLVAGGAPVTISGTPVYLAPSATTLIAGSSAMIEASMLRNPNMIIGSQTLAPDSTGAYVISGQKLTPGGLITVSDTPISLMPSSSGVVIGSSTSWFARPPHSTPIVTVGSSAYTANPASDFVIDGQTLAPGSAIDVSGTRISLVPSVPGVVVGSSTSLFPTIGNGAPVVTLGPSAYTADTASRLVIGGQTLFPGSAITVPSTTISLDSKGTAVGIQTGTQTAGVGALIMSGFGDTNGATSLAAIGALNPLNLPSTLSLATVGSLTFSVDASDIVLGGSTYPIGVGATPTTVIVGNETLNLGPGGVAFPSTTIVAQSTTNVTAQAFTGGARSRYEACGLVVEPIWVVSFAIFLAVMNA